MLTREPFVFESEDRTLVVRTMERLNSISEDKTYSIDFEDGKWYVHEVEDEDDI